VVMADPDRGLADPVIEACDEDDRAGQVCR
jgi:hypothetical protein